ncbi:MAG TPA: ABC transporter permease [Bacilli bacterium]
MQPRYYQAAAPIIIVVAFLAVWQVSASVLAVPAWLLPTPLHILAAGFADFSRILHHTAATLKITVIGFAAGVLFGIAVAVWMQLIFPWLKQGFYPLLVLSQNIPIIVLAPLFVIWFGFGLLPKVLIIILVCFFPITVALLQGFAQTEKTLSDYMGMIGANRNQRFWKLEFPHALPYLFSGLKISATYSVMGAVISEWTGAKDGIGIFMMLQKSGFRTDLVFAAIFVIVALSLGLFCLILLVEKLLIRWRPDAERGGKS